MTERTTDRPRPTENRTTMAHVSHTNPQTGESMGQVFEHGVTVVADGGRDPAREDERAEPFDAEPEEDDPSESTDATDEDESADETESTDDRDVMADVRHRTTDDAANRVFERGGEYSERDEN
ncbi:DNA polymerase V family protein [Haloarchaeobius litoreus]|uniref:DNA polymerase V family protein n=1 Tax=Haloarchaeobius litoreus TaxID=755306 RepID=A0ABD6DJC7_9EURY|nr:DNA polymerase V family protein [Haloarchaeobius litoreus]